MKCCEFSGVLRTETNNNLAGIDSATSYPAMSNHNDIWDDSALIKAYDDAIKSYKVFIY